LGGQPCEYGVPVQCFRDCRFQSSGIDVMKQSLYSYPKYTWLSRMECDFCLPGCTHCLLSGLYQLQDNHLQEHTLGIYIPCGHVCITTTDGDIIGC
jgi:hypothetical protein